MQYLMAFISIFLGAIAQYLLKLGANGIVLRKTLGGIMLDCIKNLPLISGIILYGISLLFWLYTLSQMELSKAYPLVSLGYILTLFLGYFLLDEPLNMSKILVVLFIVIGVFFITQS